MMLRELRSVTLAAAVLADKTTLEASPHTKDRCQSGHFISLGMHSIWQELLF